MLCMEKEWGGYPELVWFKHSSTFQMCSSMVCVRGMPSALVHWSPCRAWVCMSPVGTLILCLTSKGHVPILPHRGITLANALLQYCEMISRHVSAYSCNPVHAYLEVGIIELSGNYFWVNLFQEYKHKSHSSACKRFKSVYQRKMTMRIVSSGST